MLNFVGMSNSGSRGFSAIVPPCLRGYFVVPKFSLVGISWVQKIFLESISWVRKFIVGIRGSKIFSHGYFLGQNCFSREYFVCPIFSLSLISWFKDFRFLDTWARETKTGIQKYISNHIFFSKVISTFVNCLY